MWCPAQKIPLLAFSVASVSDSIPVRSVFGRVVAGRVGKLLGGRTPHSPGEPHNEEFAQMARLSSRKRKSKGGDPLAQREQLAVKVMKVADSIMLLLPEVKAAEDSGAITGRESDLLRCAIDIGEIELANARPRLAG
jgi:hypothetical protein